MWVVLRRGLGCVLLMAGLTTAHAQEWSMRCGKDLVKEGDSRSHVLAKCGKPLSKERFQEAHEDERVDPNSGKVRVYRRTERLERWVYDLGPNQFVRELVFRKGALASITLGERGADNVRRELP